jgi:hypothetical protein
MNDIDMVRAALNAAAEDYPGSWNAFNRIVEELVRLRNNDDNLRQQVEDLREALVSFTKSRYIRHQHPRRYAKAVAALEPTTEAA